MKELRMVNGEVVGARDGITVDDLSECVCCGSLHDAVGMLCPSCSDAGCNRFTDDCDSDHIPVEAADDD